MNKINILDARNPSWCSSQKAAIKVEVLFSDSGINEYVDFIAVEHDVTEYGVTLYQALVNGEYGDIQEFVELPLSELEVIELEKQWVAQELEQIAKPIASYVEDMAIPDKYSELRTSTLSEAEYYNLVGYKKLLVEYLEQADFPDCGRPSYPGLVIQ
ncbi:hypothetical protein VSVS12_03200 [Vibrio scophthalmi]|uniref:hypothetical protein n=1 Tax=Vibrio scophthalmi TaxID=45658 RepID=UPI0008094107|nr:hypothetical protein [Vibrio scophthalmi]ANS86909.1 hypothetical protein VSVS12_03200 [Vibrio scophthalmi]